MLKVWEEQIREVWTDRFIRRIRSDVYLQTYAGRLWAHLKKEADEHRSVNLLDAHVQAWRRSLETRSALGWMKDYADLAIKVIEPYEPFELEEVPRADALSQEESARAEKDLEALINNRAFAEAMEILKGPTGPAEVDTAGPKPNLQEILETLYSALERQEVRRLTARAMVICLSRERGVPTIDGNEWPETIDRIEAQAGGELFQKYQSALREIQSTGKQATNPQTTIIKNRLALLPLVQMNIRNVHRRYPKQAREYKKVYEQNRKNTQYHAAAENDLERMQEKLGRVWRAYDLVSQVDLLHPEWRGRVEHVLQRLEQLPLGVALVPPGADLASELPEISAETKRQLREERNRLVLQASIKVVIKKMSERGESLPKWEEITSSIAEEKDSTPETIHERRCKAVAALEPENIDSAEEMADRVAEAIGDPQTNVDTLRKSLQNLTLESGEEVFFTHGDHATREDRKEERQIRVERARKWCEEHDLTYCTT